MEQQISYQLSGVFADIFAKLTFTNIQNLFAFESVCIPAVGDSGLGVSGSCIVSVDTFLFVS